jgi:hypothetical protein
VAWAPDYVTSTELADYLRIDDLDDDVALALAATTASRAVDDHCTRQFGALEDAEARTYYARPDYKGGYWIVDTDDYQTATGLVVSVDGTVVTTFLKEPVNAPQKGRPWTRVAFTVDSEAQPTTHPHEVVVTALWGWTAVPEAVQQATLLQASRLFWRRNAPAGVAGSPEMGSEIRLLAKLDPDVAVSLRGYRRLRSVA